MATNPNATQIIPPRVPLTDERTGAVSREWYRWFYSLYNLVGGSLGIVPVTSGGTGLSTIPTNGQLLIGNGTGYTLNTLTASSGITVTNAAGSVTVANAGVLSNIAGNGISVSSATGNVSINNTGVLSFSGGTTGLTPTAATSGVVTLAGTLAIANGGTGASDAANARTNLAVAGTAVSNTFSANQIVSVTDNTNAALRITQLGTGNALLVEDSANPDATPFVVTNTGVIVGGNTSALDGYAGVATRQSSTFEAIGGNSAGTGLAIFGFATATSSPRATVNFNKSQSTTIGTQTIVTSNEVLGGIHFNGSDGTNYIPAAQIYGVTDGTPGTNDMPGRLVFSTTADGASTPTERMRIDSTGQTTLSGNAIISVTDNTNAALRITQLGTGNALLVEDSTNPDATPFVIDNAGNVGIGSNAPAYKLQVSGGSASASNFVIGTEITSSAGTFGFTNSNGPAIQVFGSATGNSGALIALTAGTERMRITSAGGVSFGSSGTAYGTSGQVLTSAGNAPPTWTSTASININGTVGATTPAAGTFNPLTLSATPSSNWGIDFAPSTSSPNYVTFAAAATYDIAAGSGLVVIHNNTNGDAALFLTYGGVVVKIGGAASIVSGTGILNEIGLVYNGGAGKYRINNGYLTSQSVWVTTIRTRTSS